MYQVKNNIIYKNNTPVPGVWSPNHGGIIVPRLIVIHYTGDNGRGGLRWLADPESGVSAHVWISKKGEVVQLLRLNIKGWHAGRSQYDGVPNVNDFSIGIENQGVGDEWPDEQIMAIEAVCQAISAVYNIEDIVGHDYVCLPYGRKVDPGPRFPWEKVTVPSV